MGRQSRLRAVRRKLNAASDLPIRDTAEYREAKGRSPERIGLCSKPCHCHNKCNHRAVFAPAKAEEATQE